MALVISTEYSNATAPDANYPQGSFKNSTTDTSRDGTPLEKAWPNDIYGFLQAILAAAAVTPSGAPDTALASDYLDGLTALFATAAQGALADTALQPSDLTAYLPYVGEVRMFAFQAPPAKWLACDLDPGRAVSRTTYAALFAVIGTTWGPGDGVNTFNLPPAGYFVRMFNSGATGLDASRVFGINGVEEDMIKAHAHDLGTSLHYPAVGGDTTVEQDQTGGGVTESGIGGTSGSSGGTETRPKNIPFLFAIYAGVE